MKKISLVAFLFSATQLLYSQESISTSGGKATGAGGSVNYIVGQIFNANITGSNSNTLSEGVLQQHEKITYTFNTSWLPNDPSGISFAEDDVLISTGNAIVSNTTFCNTLTVSPGAGVTINTGFSLTANTTTLNSTSQLFSSLIVNGTINGTINYNRYTALIAPTGTNDLISAPVVDQTFGSFATENTNLAASGVLRAFAPYNTIAGAYENYNTTDNAATTLAAGKGFRAATTDGSTLKFTGIARTNEVDVSISDAGNAWNLIGNPYPSYIDFATFFNENKTQFNSDSAYQALYGYDGDASNGWTVWNLATITDATITELIAPGQAFFVKVKSAGGSVKFKPAMRRTGSSDDFILGKQKSKNIALCKLRLTSATKSATTAIYFIEGTTRGLDVGYDAGRYASNSEGFSIFTNLVEDNSGLDMAIQSLPYTDFNDVVIPLGINATATEITIEIDENTKNLPDHINVYLEDTVANTLTLLNNTAYTFTPSEALIGSGRFYLRYTSKALSVLTNSFEYLQIYSANSQKEIVVKGKLNSKSSAELFDIQGRLVLRQNLDHSQISNTINVATLSAGTYIIKVFNTSQIKTQKLVIN
jgi:hypothetical protein